MAYRTTPRRLGKVYCSNRPSVVFHLTLDGVWRVLAGGDGGPQLGVGALEVSPSGALVWLERSLEVEGGPYPGPHGAAFRVMMLAGLEQEARTVVGEQQEHYTGVDPGQFCGVFTPSICPRPWLGENLLLFSCPQVGYSCLLLLLH